MTRSFIYVIWHFLSFSMHSTLYSSLWNTLTCFPDQTRHFVLSVNQKGLSPFHTVVRAHQFVLKMCSANRWRFQCEKKFVAWARQERRDRVESRLAFATTEEVRNETQYFKDASFHYQLSQAEERYRGSLLLIANVKGGWDSAGYGGYGACHICG